MLCLKRMLSWLVCTSSHSVLTTCKRFDFCIVYDSPLCVVSCICNHKYFYNSQNTILSFSFMKVNICYMFISIRHWGRVSPGCIRRSYVPVPLVLLLEVCIMQARSWISEVCVSKSYGQVELVVPKNTMDFAHFQQWCLVWLVPVCKLVSQDVHFGKGNWDWG